MVNSLRQDQPVLGGRKLYHILKTKIHPDLDIGRDKFFDLLRDNGLLIRHSRVYRPVTTLSWNRFHKYPNLIKDYDPLSANQLYVADITYVRNVEGRFYYLVNMALETLPPGSDLIHHSDRGVQYCSKDYISILQGIKCRISMTENGDPRENAIAERVNGILKEEWLNKEMITTLGQKVIDIYNTRRPHSSVEMLTPEEAHAKKGPLKRKWKTIYKRKQAILL